MAPRSIPLKPLAAVLPPVALSLAFRVACFAAMVWMALWAEARPAPSLPDALLQVIPYVPVVDRYNYLVWTLVYVPMAAALLATHWRRFCQYMVTAGVLSLVRGVCIVATGLGPVHGSDVNAGIDLGARTQAFFRLLNPANAFGAGAPGLYLTKDLFFSGHTATTFLLLLYVWPYRRLRAAMLVGHAVVVATVFLSHLHYTIDVIGAYGMAFTTYAIAERVTSTRRAASESPPSPSSAAAASGAR